jgi:hypothetical protein
LIRAAAAAAAAIAVVSKHTQNVNTQKRARVLNTPEGGEVRKKNNKRNNNINYERINK